MKTFKELIQSTFKKTSDEVKEVVQEEDKKDEKKQSIESKEEMLDCLLCSIMEAFGLPKHTLRDYKPEKLPELFGGDSQIIIEIGGPENAYKEDSFIDIIKDIEHMVSLDKDYKDEDVKVIRANKERNGASLKKLLALMDDAHIVKTFKAIQKHKNGGQVIEFDEYGRKITPERKIREAISGEEVILPNDLSKEQLEGKKIVKTMKGEGRFINKKFYFNNNIPKEYGGVKSDAEGDIIEDKTSKTEDIQAQTIPEPKEGQIRVRINNIEYNLWEAKTEEEKEKGLKGIEKLEDYEGMIFYYDKPQKVQFWMQDTPIDLTIAFFDEDEECISVKKGKALSEELIPEDNVMFVIELNVNADVKPGDELDIVGVDDDEYVMSVLDQNGESQYELKSGQRIFSRKSTEIIIKKSKRAYKNRNNPRYDNYCKSLGKYVFKELNAQDEREPEYVTLND